MIFIPTRGKWCISCRGKINFAYISPVHRLHRRSGDCEHHDPDDPEDPDDGAGVRLENNDSFRMGFIADDGLSLGDVLPAPASNGLPYPQAYSCAIDTPHAHQWRSAARRPFGNLVAI